MTSTSEHRRRLGDIQVRLGEAYRRFKVRHEAGRPGRELNRAMSDFRDEVLLELWEGACRDLAPGFATGDRGPLALIALGGTGRRDAAPFSDVDLMILRPRTIDLALEKAAKRFFRDVFDIGLQLGHSIRTVPQAIALAKSDPQIYTSLVDSRRLVGSTTLHKRFSDRFGRLFRGGSSRWLGEILRERAGERIRFGESVYLLEPNVKRSSGCLRDIQLLRWIARLRYGVSSFDGLALRGLLTTEARDDLLTAEAFLLTLRNELHFHADKGRDVLDRRQQQRISEKRGYVPTSGILPVEQFMRDYFRHTARVRHLLDRFVEKADSHGPRAPRWTVLFGHRTDGGFHVGPRYLVAGRHALAKIEDDWGVVLQMVDLANLYGRAVHPATWDAVHRLHPASPPAVAGEAEPRLPPTAVRHFLSLLGHPGELGRLLRELHGYGFLERIVPPLTHARGLLQFNQYHKYTVDEHCLRAVEHATDLLDNPRPIGEAYRQIGQKHLLHLALLIHDLGKGHLDDHRELGRQLAERIAARLGLDDDQTDTLSFLVLHHEMMNRLAFRRDTSDEGLVVQLAVDVKSPERLRMLFVTTACDLAAVGPGVWDRWKEDVLTDLYRRTMRHLAGDSESVDEAARLRRETKRLLAEEPDAPWLEKTVERLPVSFLDGGAPRNLAAQLHLIKDLAPREVRVLVSYRSATSTLDVTIATHEQTTDGVFHKLTGALAAKGLAILSAEIHTLDDGVILDRFTVTDPDSRAEPREDRVTEIREGLERALLDGSAEATSYRRTWGADRHTTSMQVAKTWVQADNHSSDRYTILDVFTSDRPGLLHRIARALYDLELSVHRAKVGTFLDQVVDVFYVVDRQGRKIEGDLRLQQVRLRLLRDVLSRSNVESDLT